MKAAGALSPEEFVDRCLDLVGPLEVDEATRKELVAKGWEDGELRWDSDAAATASERRVGIMLALIAATREFQFA